MRVALVMPCRWRRFSLNMEELGRAILAAGHEAVLVCRGIDEETCGIPVVIASPADEASRDFWRRRDVDLAICFTNLAAPETHRALRETGVFVVARADSDGQLGFRVFPAAAFLRMVHPAAHPFDALKRARHFVNCWLFHHRGFDRRTLQTLEGSDAVVIETELARCNLERFLRYHRREDLIPLISVVPHPVADCFISPPVTPDPGPGILCIGRWNDDQKNAPLMLATIRRILDGNPGAKILTAGAGAGEVFRAVAGSPRVGIIGHLPNPEIPALIDRCRFILSSSRWEGHPISGLEALCRGRTVVATPVPGFVDMVGQGEFGSISAKHSPEALSRAAFREIEAWDNGRRSPEAIAAHWRPLVNHAEVVAKILAIRNRA